MLQARIDNPTDEELETALDELVAIAEDVREKSRCRLAPPMTRPRALAGAHRLARPRAALAPRHRGDGVDRDVVLLRPPRPVAPAAEGPGRRGGRRRGRALGGARRRLLPGAEVRRRAAAAAGPRRLVQVGGVHDVALRLRPDARPLLPRGVERAREAGRRPRPVARRRDLDRPPRPGLDRLRRAQPPRLGRARAVAGALRARRAGGLGLDGALQPARRGSRSAR